MSDDSHRALSKLQSSDAITADRLVRRVYQPDGDSDGERAINAAWTAYSILLFAGTNDVHGKALRSPILTYVFDTAAAQRLHRDVIEPTGRSALDAELLREVRNLIEALNLPDAAPMTEEEALAEGLDVLPWDDVLARYLETLGECGRDAAKHLRNKSRERAAAPERWRRWAEWCGLTNDGVLYRLAMCLWVDRVGARLTRHANGHPAIPFEVSDYVVDLESRKSKAIAEKGGQLVLEFHRPTPNRRVEIADRLHGQVLVTCDTEALKAIEVSMTGRVHELGSVIGHEYFRWVVRTCWERERDGEKAYFEFGTDDGWGHLMEMIKGKGREGGVSKREIEQLKRVAEAYDACIVRVSRGGNEANVWTGRLITMAKTQRGKGRADRITLSASEIIRPNAHELFDENTPIGRMGRRYVPILDIPPRVGGRDRDRGPEIAYSLKMTTFMRAHVRDLHPSQFGGVLFREEDLDALAEHAGLPVDGASSVRKLMDRWTQDGDEGPAYLRRVERSRYTLNPEFSETHARALRFLQEAAERELQGAEGARRGKANKAAKLLRIGGKPGK